ncbi:DNA cytosine methyltransferase [Chitinophaga arvensicola]|uniref:DNA (cytosine-5-)-methyltransferase n=1 Tax=Chitinophaga arvensicola TaxID=29529 RepID=A0A1I0SAT7_9BACT|nr:DNA (cytosine-5-)-methyltransferase [Chitinophaga arvensicola]SEW53500.1 DNA (cytosine-5)-methyltransferase 1 [Chitinophaga arvensicola]
MIPIIDIFAGPGGLGEGFSSVFNSRHERVFKIKLSIEKDSYAHQTLQLRSFFRQFPVGEVPEEYYQFVRGKISLEELYELYPGEARLAADEAWCGTLGDPDEKDTNGVSNEEVDKRISRVLRGAGDWVLIGGPPCQAYSLAGRSRRQEKKLDSSKDKRVGLYKEYLRIIAVHKPAVFVMENVKGLLSAQTEEEYVFGRILKDLSDPVSACISEGETIDAKKKMIKYRIYSLTTKPTQYDLYGTPSYDPRDFIIKAEDYGVPQKRHRVILLGVREDISAPRKVLQKQKEVTLKSVIGSLPVIRSGVTKEFSHITTIQDEEGNEKKKRHYKNVEDNEERWLRYIQRYTRQVDRILKIEEDREGIVYPSSLGKEFMGPGKFNLKVGHPLRSWYADDRLNGVMHHVSRKHLVQDLKRYLFAARYVEVNGNFPRMEDYKKAGADLLPDHENADSGKFSDRFRVQLPDSSATTITSHIAKDGHYFIHYDPVQCRSLTVRESARAQTFPDNYYFCGERTQQFHQVGNAVPPYLAYQIAQIVQDIFY